MLRHAVMLAGFAIVAGGCTAFVVVTLNGKEGAGPAQGGCFNLPSNACGNCIATQCECTTSECSPIRSLSAVCGFSTQSTLPSEVRACATDPSVGYNYSDNCSQFFVDGGTYASSVTTQAAAENNVTLCVRDYCKGDCRTCSTSVKVCDTDKTPLEDAGGCGACLYKAMSIANSPCQDIMAGSDYYCNDIASDLSACATPVGSSTCVTADCSGISQAEGGLAQCLWSQCASSCPN